MGNNQGSTNDLNSAGISFSKQELTILYKNFLSLDQDKSGKLEPNEFFDVPELKENPVVQRMISVFDKNQDGKISFYEFVMGLSTLADNDKHEEKYKFAFQIYDVNNDGFISNGDLFFTLKTLVGENFDDVQIQQVVDRTIIMVDKDMDGLISYDEFIEFVQYMKLHELFSMNIFDIPNM
jgi:serine/threonine-protein phosphatase 2B regulatory subunit